VVKAHLEGIGYTDVSEIKDRNYFHSIYCRSPGGILCEVATCDIGFAIDEPMDKLGQKMLLPPWFDDPELARPYFRRLRGLRDRLIEEGIDAAQLHELSMGMSHDFEVAIQEGATLVRVGTAIFGKRIVRT